VLHVDRAATPYVAVDEGAREWIVLPRGRVGFDDVEVRVQQNRRFFPVSAHARNEAGATGIAFDDLRIDAGFMQKFRDAFCGGALVPVTRRARAEVHRGNAQEILKKLNALLRLCIPIDGGHARGD